MHYYQRDKNTLGLGLSNTAPWPQCSTMADSVQASLDKMMVDLSCLKERGLVAKREIRSIVKQRTEKEYKCRRHQTTPENFLGYIRYDKSL